MKQISEKSIHEQVLKGKFMGFTFKFDFSSDG